MSIHRLIIKGLSWQTVAVASQALTQLIVLALLARLLEPEDFGLMAMAGVAIAFGQLLSEAGTGPAVVQRQKELDSAFVSTALILSLFIGFLLFLCQVILAPRLETFLAMDGLEAVLTVLGVVFVINWLSRVPEAILQRELKFSQLMKVNLFAQIAGNAVPAILLALAGFGVWSLVFGALLQSLLKAITLLFISGNKFSLEFSRGSLQELFLFGASMTKIKFWNYVIQQGDRFIIGRKLNVDMLGQYQVIAQLAQMPGQYLGNILDSVFFPIMSRLKNESMQLKKMYLMLASHSFVLMLAFGLFLSVNSHLFIGVILGEKWYAVEPLFQMFCLTAGFRIIARLADTVNRSLGQVFKASIYKMFMAIIFLFAVWFSAPYGLTAICAAVVLCQVLTAMSISSLAWKGLELCWTEAVENMTHGFIGITQFVLLNGFFFYLLQNIENLDWIIFIVSALVNGALAFMYFRPLIKSWQGEDNMFAS